MRAIPRTARDATITVLLAASLSLAGESSAEERDRSVYPVIPGVKVRLVAPDAVKGRAVGTVLEADDRSLLIQPTEQPPIRVPWQSITKLEVSQGRRGNWKKGALIGAAFGAVTYMATLARPEEKWTCYPFGDVDHLRPYTCSNRTQAAVAGVFMVPAGLLIGHFVKSDTWRPAAREGVQVGLAGPPVGRGLGLGLSVRW